MVLLTLLGSKVLGRGSVCVPFSPPCSFSVEASAASAAAASASFLAFSAAAAASSSSSSSSSDRGGGKSSSSVWVAIVKVSTLRTGADTGAGAAASVEVPASCLSGEDGAVLLPSPSSPSLAASDIAEVSAVASAAAAGDLDASTPGTAGASLFSSPSMYSSKLPPVPRPALDEAAPPAAAEPDEAAVEVADLSARRALSCSSRRFFSSRAAARLARASSAIFQSNTKNGAATTYRCSQ
mmetsp:Transcript_26179/g.58179  ORF Transcript_26179/g.58179 Transcript_26179/m.58179 type:complete len:239 (+) Transcript_26179:898-1614(+)